MKSSELITLFSSILTLRNLKHLEIEIYIVHYEIEETTHLNPMISEESFENLSKL